MDPEGFRERSPLIVDLVALRLSNSPLLVKRAFKEDAFDLAGEDVALREPVQVDLKVDATGERFTVAGTVQTELELTCCRCACLFSRGVDKSFRVEYWPDTTEEDAEIELDYHDLEVGFYHGDSFDLREVILEQALIDLPMRPICSEDCKGLCEGCGADLNKEKCSCDGLRIDPRFEALQKLKDRMK